MRIVPAFLVIVPIGIGSLIAYHESRVEASASDVVISTPSAPVGSVEWISDFERYRDEDYDFSMAIPAGWSPIVTLADDTSSPDDGYAISFEAPPDSTVDHFADYIMVEILPGDRSGRFLTDGTQAQPISIGGLHGVRERLAIDRHDMGDALLDLVVIQAEVSGLGFTVGFYAIGESSRRPMLEDAFELLVRTFELDRPPFRVS